MTHAHSDGPAPHFTVITPARRGADVMLWDEVEATVSPGHHPAPATPSPTITRSAGTTCRGSIGCASRQMPTVSPDPPFTDVLRATKRTLDPRGILNPGALLPS
ncbi:FAD-linked oxidase C-terminal domain-containing protein [Dactylosporangium sp. NPDC000521]|uniref:FAD-linked oxidase C-terminal domain-containing protein n=1 Tax=Dactylosporangium sp. NPDC000521 TaxID=3363975 RepID=UPI0036891B05